MNDTNENHEFAADQIAEKAIASALSETLRVYLTLLEDGTNKAGFKECGTTIRHLATCLQECSYTSFAEDDEEPDPDGGEELTEMEKFYADNEEAD